MRKDPEALRKLARHEVKRTRRAVRTARELEPRVEATILQKLRGE